MEVLLCLLLQHPGHTPAAMSAFTSQDAQKLLHNKFVVVLGDSIQRSVYKDLVMLLQHDSYLSEGQLKRKGEMTFENDMLVEGGQLNEMHNGIDYREVRQYRTGHHLVRFYFLTRVYSMYLESVLADFTAGPQPDVLIINSCFWDLTRYTFAPMEEYKANLQKLFSRLSKALNPECLILWNMTMPGGYKDAEIPQHIKYNLKWDVVEGNFYSATLANQYSIDVLDMHYHFRLELQRRCRDAIHWDQLAHRKYTQLLLAHIAQGWGVEAPQKKGVSDHHDQAVPRKKATRKRRKASLPIQHGAKEVQMSLSIPCPEYVKVNGDCHHFASDIQPQPGFFYPGYVSFEMNHTGDAAADDHFTSDSPRLAGASMPGYHSIKRKVYNSIRSIAQTLECGRWVEELYRQCFILTWNWSPVPPPHPPCFHLIIMSIQTLIAAFVREERRSGLELRRQHQSITLTRRSRT
uniref:PC-esterase domain-containing protein 1A n=1 Tax=Leptobrachium leishanense TaxID=445787 RepID=A0A8C5Q907_9ANUR